MQENIDSNQLRVTCDLCGVFAHMFLNISNVWGLYQASTRMLEERHVSIHDPKATLLYPKGYIIDRACIRV
jgi:hypothetical protein